MLLWWAEFAVHTARYFHCSERVFHLNTMARAQLRDEQWEKIEAVLESQRGAGRRGTRELVGQMTTPTRQPLNHAVREHEEIQREPVNVEPLVIKYLHPSPLRPIRDQVARFRARARARARLRARTRPIQGRTLALRPRRS